MGCDLGRLATASGLPGLHDANKGFHYAVLLLWMFKIFYTKIRGKRSLQGLKAREEKGKIQLCKN